MPSRGVGFAGAGNGRAVGSSFSGIGQAKREILIRENIGWFFSRTYPVVYRMI